MFSNLLESITICGGAALGTLPYWRNNSTRSLRAYFRDEPLEAAHCALMFLFGLWIKIVTYRGLDANHLYAPLLQHASPHAYSALFLLLGIGSFYAIYFHARFLRQFVAVCCAVMWAFLAFYYWTDEIHVMGVPLCFWFVCLNAKIYAHNGRHIAAR